jgi:hypothetical protein
MPARYFLRLPDARRARGDDPDLAFHSEGANGLAEELQHALRTRSLFDRWLHQQDDPDEIEGSLAATDAQAQVRGEQHDLHVELVVVTSLPGAVLKHRLHLLAGANWQLRDVTSA